MEGLRDLRDWPGRTGAPVCRRRCSGRCRDECAPIAQTVVAVKIAPSTIDEFIDLYAQEYGEALERDEAEHMIRQLFAFYRPLYEWHYDRHHRLQPRTDGEGS